MDVETRHRKDGPRLVFRPNTEQVLDDRCFSVRRVNSRYSDSANALSIAEDYQLHAGLDAVARAAVDEDGRVRRGADGIEDRALGQIVGNDLADRLYGRVRGRFLNQGVAVALSWPRGGGADLGRAAEKAACCRFA